MANSRFIGASSNRAVRYKGTDTFPKLINGAGGYSGAPPVCELPSHPMDNALNRDRATVWATPANPENDGVSGVVLDIDLGSPRSILGFGLLGYEQATPDAAAFPNNVYAAYLASPTTYSNSFIFEWPAQQLPAVNPLHIASVARSSRFWRIWFENSAFGDGFSVGKVLLYDAIADLGLRYSGDDRELVDPEILTTSGADTPIITKVGRLYLVQKLSFARVRSTVLGTLFTLASSRRSFVYIDGDGTVREVIIDGGRFPHTHLFGSPDSYAITLPLRELP